MLNNKLQKFHEVTEQRHKRHSELVELAVKRDLKKGPRNEYAKDERKQDTAHCSECGWKAHIKRVFKSIVGFYRVEENRHASRFRLNKLTRSQVRNSKGEISEVVDRGCFRISTTPSRRNFNCELKNVFMNLHMV